MSASQINILQQAHNISVSTDYINTLRQHATSTDHANLPHQHVKPIVTSTSQINILQAHNISVSTYYINRTHKPVTPTQNVNLECYDNTSHKPLAITCRHVTPSSHIWMSLLPVKSICYTKPVTSVYQPFIPTDIQSTFLHLIKKSEYLDAILPYKRKCNEKIVLLFFPFCAPSLQVASSSQPFSYSSKTWYIFNVFKLFLHFLSGFIHKKNS